MVKASLLLEWLCESVLSAEEVSSVTLSLQFGGMWFQSLPQYHTYVSLFAYSLVICVCSALSHPALSSLRFGLGL
jgi:hypothetical protein